MGAIYSTKITEISVQIWMGLLSFKKISLLFEVDHFSRLDRSDRNGPFHLTIPTHSQSQDLAVRYLPCTKWRKILITALLWIVNGGSIGVTRTSMYIYDRSVVASQAKCMFWLLTSLKDDLFLERIFKVLFLIRFEDFESGVWSHMVNILERSTQNNPFYCLNYFIT